MRTVMVKLVFIVYCDVCDTTCCCVRFKCYSFTYVHCLCSLCVNLLHMYTVFVLYVWHPHFPLKE